MARYRGGYDRQANYWNGDWSDPYGAMGGGRSRRGPQGERPWVGGYHPGYQGGTEGIPMRTTPGGYGGPRGYGADYNRGGNVGRQGGGYGRDFSRRGGRDYWWLASGGREREEHLTDYDRTYQRFHEENHPRFSPVGGMYHAMGGSYMQGRARGPLGYDKWFSDWTRWF